MRGAMTGGKLSDDGASSGRTWSPQRAPFVMPVNVGDVTTELAGLSLEEEGLTHRLWRQLWIAGGAFPDDDHRIARRLNVDVRVYRRIIEALVARGIVERSQGVITSRQTTEQLDAVAARREAAAQAGAQGAEARKANAVRQALSPEVRPTSAKSSADVSRNQREKSNKNKYATMAYTEPNPYPNTNTALSESRAPREVRLIRDNACGCGVDVDRLWRDVQGDRHRETRFLDRCVAEINDLVDGNVHPAEIRNAITAGPEGSELRARLHALIMKVADRREQEVRSGGPSSRNVSHPPSAIGTDGECLEVAP